MSSTTLSRVSVGVPKLRLHKASSQWVADIDGRTRYYGRDEQDAWRPFLIDLTAWRNLHNRKDGVTVREAVERFVLFIADKGAGAQSCLRTNLRAFHLERGSLAIDAIDTDMIEAFKADCAAKYKPKTTNHYLTAAKRLIRFAAYKGWRSPIELSFIHAVPCPPPPPKHLPIATIAGWLDKADEYHEQLGIYLRLCLATACRPSEVLTLVNRETEEVDEGVFRLAHSKTGPNRLLVLPPPIKLLLARTQAPARWKQIASFSQACKKAMDSGPHRLRHSAAFLVHRIPGAQIDRQDTDFYLGHGIPYVSAVYNVIDYDRLKRVGASYNSYLQATLPKHFPVV